MNRTRYFTQLYAWKIRCTKGKICGQVFINNVDQAVINILIDISTDTQSTSGDSQPGVDQLICTDWKLVDRLLTEMSSIDLSVKQDANGGSIECINY